MIDKFKVDTPYPVGAVHFYKKDYGDFSVLFDTGPNTEAAKNYLTSALDLSTLKYVFITHCHVDHYGLADFIIKHSDAKVVLSKYDYLRHKFFDQRVSSFLGILVEVGFNESEIMEFKKVLNGFKNVAPFPEDVLLLEESQDILRELGIDYIRCPGHSQSDIVYLIDKFAISGDVVLRGIFQTPLLDIEVENFKNRFKNYEEFTKSMIKLKNIEGRIFLPGHREFIDSIDERLLFYTDKLLTRAILIKGDLKNFGTIYVLKKLVGSVYENPLTAYLKLSELVFINDLLSRPSLLTDTLKDVGLYKDLREKIEKIME